MRKKEISKNIILAISISCIIIVMIIGSFSALFLNKNYYELLYQKTGSYERIDKDIVNNKTDELFLFFENKSALDVNFYTKNEISHLNDVKEIIRKVFLIYYLALFFLLISIIFLYVSFKERCVLLILKMLFYSGTIILVIALLFFVFNFSGIFEEFHKIFFFKGNYAFPSSSNMIKMFNEEFFQLFAERIFVISIIKGAIGLIISAILIWKAKRHD